MQHISMLKFARTETGYALRIEGRGTMTLSRPAEAFAEEALAEGSQSLVVDLYACQYLDSTFLGCLLGMHRRHGGSRVKVAAPPEVVGKLFGPTKLNVVLGVSAGMPAVIGDFVTLPPEAMNSRDMARHIMECHRRLADIPGPQQTAFAAIAENMARDLDARQGESA